MYRENRVNIKSGKANWLKCLLYSTVYVQVYRDHAPKNERAPGMKEVLSAGTLPQNYLITCIRTYFDQAED